jgi:hypothetical protein
MGTVPTGFMVQAGQMLQDTVCRSAFETINLRDIPSRPDNEKNMLKLSGFCAKIPLILFIDL